MTRWCATLTLCAALGLEAFAQPVLLPSLGIASLPADADAMCPLPVQTPPIVQCGRPEGEQAADFTLYDLNGNAFNLNDALLLGKPVLLISASYTCPVFRNKVPLINTIVVTYDGQLTTAIIYTPEAHPAIDPSPYFGAVNTGQANISAGILHQQPQTYGERKAIVQAMLDSMDIDAPVYLDGPCHPWWNYYGPQPNNAYLIGTTGTILRHHDWLDKAPDDILCDIDTLLGLPANCTASYGGSFTFELVGNDTVEGPAGTTLTGSGLLTNPTGNDCLVRIVKLQMNMPADWESSLCADICYLPDVDTAVVVLPANSTMDFHYYFYTGTAATGRTRVGFRNEEQPSNQYLQDYWATATAATGMAEVQRNTAWQAFPNPADDHVTYTGLPPGAVVRWLDAAGREVLTSDARGTTVQQLPPGLYALRPWLNGMPVGAALRVVVR